MADKTTNRYTRVAMALHWGMAIAFFLMLGSGLAFDRIEMPNSFKFDLYQWHKSLGVILLLLIFLRVVWRLFHQPPPLPKSMKKFDVVAAKLGHIGLYALMILIPVSGWVMVSSSPYGLPTIVFGLFEWPHIPLPEDKNMINTLSKNAHEYMGYAFLAMIVIHITATFKHLWLEKINLLKRMSPFMFAIAFIPSVANAAPYQVDYDQSTVAFAGKHAGNDFDGVFEEWTADIVFDGNNLDQSSVSVTFQTESAKTGNLAYDGTLPESGWFYIEKYPTATFQSTSFSKTDNGYSVTGDLTIRDITKPVTFDFTLEGDEPTIMSSTFTIQRMDYDIGAEADPNQDWVDNDITLTLNITATKGD